MSYVPPIGSTEPTIVNADPQHMDELNPGRFLTAGLVASPLTLTIDRVHTEWLEGKSGLRLRGVMSFSDHQLQLPLNKTNVICLAAMFGAHVPAWRAKRVTWCQLPWNGEPAIRIHGSPDIERDIDVIVELARKKPFKLKMHAPKQQTAKANLSERCQEVMKLMGVTSTVDALIDLEADIATESFTDAENALLSKAFAKRKAQIGKTAP